MANIHTTNQVTRTNPPIHLSTYPPVVPEERDPARPPAPRRPLEGVRGNHLSNGTCLAQAFFESGESRTVANDAVS